MRETRIYLKPEQITDTMQINDRKIINKLVNVLRLRKNQPVYIFDGEGKEYLYIIDKINKRDILVKRKGIFKTALSPLKRIILAFPVVREEKIDFILQKGTELGVFKFIPFNCKRSINIQSSNNKLERWQRIIIEAARQSERLWLPLLNPVLDLKEVLEDNYESKFIASIEGSYLDKDFRLDAQEVLLVVGPEGGFTDSENLLLKKSNFKFIKLSNNTLRVETASIFFAGLFNYLFSTK